MWNIIKAQNYQIKRDLVSVIALIVTAVIVGIIIISGYQKVGFSEFSGSVYLSLAGEVMVLVVPLITLLFATRIGGWDYVDKTMNYEVLMGHSRREVFFGRVIAALIWNLLIVVVIVSVPTAILSIINGFGVNMNLGDMVARYLMSLLPVVRMTCGFVCLSFVLRNGNLAMVIGFLLVEGELLLSEILYEMGGISLTYQFSCTNIKWLIADMNIVLGYVDGTDVYLYETMIEPSMVIFTVITSVVMSAIYVTIGYLVFRRQDQR